jgi:glycosyltransferase involved in cell wall biosynthesis
MRIGLIAPPWIPVPPQGYGGTEIVVDNLARGLTELGHDVRLFTVGESTCPVRRDWLYPAAVHPMGTSVEEAAHVLAAYQSLTDVDLIHDHTVLGPLLAMQTKQPSPPVVTTQHGAFTAENLRIFAEIAKRAAIVAISRDQASRAGRVPITAIIHHGIDLDVYQPGPGDGGYLLFIGRMSAEKGIAGAVRIAHASGRPLVLATKIRTAAEWDYYQREVQPLLGPGDKLMTEPPMASLLHVLQGATAQINPITWPEPFGLVMAEALATGTPVLAFPHGAAPEIIDDGKTGFLCWDEADMVAAIGRVEQIDRAECRAAAEQRFSLQRMARDYERLYQRLLDDPSGPAGQPPRREHHQPQPHTAYASDRATLTAEVHFDSALDVLRRAAGSCGRHRGGDPGRGLDVLHQRRGR